MRTLAIQTLAATAALLSGLSMAAAAGPHFVGPVTGSPERDTYATTVAYAGTQALCIAGPARYFGAMTGNAEKDAYGYPMKLVVTPKCPDEGTVAAAQ